MFLNVSDFKASPRFLEVQERMQMFVFRGRDADNLNTNTLSFKLNSSVEVTNILGYALNKKIVVDDALLSENFWTNDLSIIEEKDRLQLEKVVKQMGSFQFDLMPLVLVRGETMMETLLIKVVERNGVKYVDISGRVYKDFRDFLANNQFPAGVLCYLRDGIVSVNAAGAMEIECCTVGIKNTVLNVTEVLVGAVGAVGTIGAIFATGGLAIPMLVMSYGSAAYVTGRSIEKLVDASKHGQSLNPLQDAEARKNWLMISANLLAFTSAGVSKMATMEGLAAKHVTRLFMANRIVKGGGALVSTAAIVDSIVYSVNNWKSLPLHEQIMLVCSICFCGREVISFANAERLMRANKTEGVSNFFAQYCESGCQMVSNSNFMLNVRKMFQENDEYLEAALKLVKNLIRENISITVNQHFTKIKFFGFEYEISTLLRIKEMDHFMYTIQGIVQSLKDTFSLLRTSFGDENVMDISFKRAQDLGGNRADFGTAINEILEVFSLILKISKNVAVLTQASIIIGAGHKFTVASAFDILIKTAKEKAVTLIKALVQMNSTEADQMNQIRSQIPDTTIFNWIITGSNVSDDMLAKIRFLLDVEKICTNKSLHITALDRNEGTIEIEYLINIDLQLFNNATHRFFVVDPIFLNICKPALRSFRSYLVKLWQNTCTAPISLDNHFEKLITLENAFKLYPGSVENVVNYTKTMKCVNLPQFIYHALFALSNLERSLSEDGMDQAAANSALFDDSNFLPDRFLRLQARAEELCYGGYCTVDDNQLTEPDRILEVVKTLAAKEALRFGTIENAVLHLYRNPMLRRAGEIKKYNRIIAIKKFQQQEVKLADGCNDRRKWMVYLGNEQVKIFVCVIPDQGAYIDSFLFSLEN
ncbi:uncharacterized protein LOC131689126 [Topomyia yanbarensis]|uniref:uncharacterized protein LOC131689126 n=1 Tax=Topomyia yanbarensis TaxID=2498891 RepID=UPI00273C7B77|nr:uncharacterized protein LOC131689126 [Topomyia yanbarensis]XP_058829966.1 uncharacterized protein LOC131689126 [Topomyia yanbarensis]